MKSIKISETAHQQLKVFAAKAQYNINVIASDAIIKYVKEQGSPLKQSKK